MAAEAKGVIEDTKATRETKVKVAMMELMGARANLASPDFLAAKGPRDQTV